MNTESERKRALFRILQTSTDINTIPANQVFKWEWNVFHIQNFWNVQKCGGGRGGDDDDAYQDSPQNES